MSPTCRDSCPPSLSNLHVEVLMSCPCWVACPCYICRFLNVFWTLAWRARRLVKICWLSNFLFLFLLCLSDGMVEFSHCFNALIVPVFTSFFTLKGGSKLVTIMYWFFLFSEMCFKSIKLLFCRNVLVIAQQIHSLLSAAKI